MLDIKQNNDFYDFLGSFLLEGLECFEWKLRLYTEDFHALNKNVL